MPSISFVGASTGWSSSATSTSFTINLPSGTLQAGDLLIGVLAWTTGQDDTDLGVTVPSGWTKQDEVFKATDGFDSQLCVMTKTYAVGDPSSWTGTLGSNLAHMKVSGCVAYRGVQGILAKGTASGGDSVSSYKTATVNNTLSGTWRVACAAYEAATLDYNITINDAANRFLYGDSEPDGSFTDAVQLTIDDSNAAIATGNSNRTVTNSIGWDASTSWIALLQVQTGTPASGTFGITLGGVDDFSGTGTVHDDASMAATLGGVVIEASGYGQPPVVTGTFAEPLSGVSVDVEAARDVIGSMAMLILPNINLVAETRVFGVRVIAVEPDDRTITVQSRGVDD